MKKTADKTLMFSLLLTLIGLTEVYKAQTTTTKVITDVETGFTYYTDVTRYADNSIEFAMKPEERIPTPDVDPSERLWESGPRMEFTQTIYTPLGLVTVHFLACGNQMFWPCAWCPNTYPN